MPAPSNSPTKSVRRTDGWALGALALAGVVACAHGAPPTTSGGEAAGQSAKAPTHPPPAGPTPRAALLAFVAAADRGDFEACHALLAAPLRERYTVRRLAEDFQAVRGLAEDKLVWARAAASAEPALADGRAEFAVGERRAVRLVLEAGSWKVASLE